MRWIGSYARGRRAAALLSLSLIGASLPAFAASSARSLYEKAVAAEKQLKKSEKLRSSKKAWLDVARSYHRVVLNHPRSGYCDDALWFEGEIYRDADKRFRDRDAVRKALDAYLLLVNGYPASKWCRKAYLRRADLYLNRLSSPTAAKKELRNVLARGSKSEEAKQARQLLVSLNRGTNRASSQRVAVRDIRHWTGKEYTRIVIDMDKEVKYRQGRLTKPDRIYFDLYDTQISTSLASRTFLIGDGFLKQIRAGQNQPDVVRVVLDFESISRYNVFSLHDPYRLVVDILGIKPEEATRVARRERPTSSPPPKTIPSAGGAGPPAPKATGADGESASSLDAPATVKTEDSERAGAEAATEPELDLPPPLPPDPTPDGRFPLARQLGLTARRVVIDPGHGGHDPGTKGGGGLEEKELVLDISRRVARTLERDGEYEVLMTRNTDVYIPLEERTAIANSQGADLFVSIHVNAHPNRRVRGIETFYLNLATSPEAEETAARENAVSTRRMGELQELLRQIMNNSKIAESSDFAHQVQNAMARGVLGTKTHTKRNHGVKTAPFYVLLGANMPSILVEVSFLSNSEDARLLSTDNFRQRLAESIASGIRIYTSSLKKVARAPNQGSGVSQGTKQRNRH